MSSELETYYTPEQYLEMERKADFKSEYWYGHIYPLGGIVGMAGAGEAHNLIVTNVVRELSIQLKGRPCRTYPSDMKVEVGPDAMFVYPDVSVVCGEPRFHDDRRDMVQNPTMVVEVLSPATEKYDRGAKSAKYRVLESVTDYILISATEVRIEHYVRQPDDRWLLTDFTDDQQTVPITSLGCELKVVEVYDRVEFPPITVLRAEGS